MMDLTGWDLWFYFILYAVIGWIGEVIFAFHVHKKFVNRGFLNGPLCPMYGLGALLFIAIGNIFPHNIIALFFATAIAATILEYITGYLLEVLFHRRYWDYSNTKFNINGYVTLSATIAWGVIGVLAIYVVLPFMFNLCDKIPYSVRHVFSIVTLVIFVVDLVATVGQNIKLSQQLEKIRVLSEKMTDGRHQTQDRKKLEKEFGKQTASLQYGSKRILNAYPNLQSKQYDSALSAVRTAQEKVTHQLDVVKENYQNAWAEAKEHILPKNNDQKAAPQEQKKALKETKRGLKSYYRGLKRKIRKEGSLDDESDSLDIRSS